ncbi:MAG: HesA/MoeB/ThiF family protein [Bacteroidia bacterium]|nr:HesA/MoeB/ThiF family protein [Bacteroidia bacterium]
MNRFERQINLRGLGSEGQKKLSNASVLIIGAGGLGCPALLYLAAAGVGRIGIVDGDTVALSNLNRQILFGEHDAGKKKAEIAREIIQQKYSDIIVDVFPYFLDTSNALPLIKKYDLVLDCTDNFSVRYMVNDACVLLNKPLVYGAIYEYEGQVSVFNVLDNKGISYNYRQLFPVPPSASEVPNCAQTGVLGVLPGMIGTLQATEAIKYLTGIGQVLAGKVWYYNLEFQQFYELEIQSSEKNIPVTLQSFLSYDYSLSCAEVQMINWNKAFELFNLSPQNAIFVDVREIGELPECENFSFAQIPLSTLLENYKQISNKNTLLLFCQAGVRSIKAAKILYTVFPNKKIYSIKGGIMDNLSPVKSISI